MLGQNKKPASTRRIPTKGGGKAPVFSYYNNRPSGEATKPRPKSSTGFRWQLLPSFLAAAVIAGSLVYVSILDMNPRVSLQASGSTALLQDEAVYTGAATAALKSSLFNRSKLLINTKPLERRLQEQFPELKTVGITIPLASRRPIVTLKAVEARLLLKTSKGNFIIDAAGRAVRQLTDTALAETLKLPVVQDESGLEPRLGSITLTAREAAFISELYHQLAAKDLTPVTLTLPALLNEAHTTIPNQPYYVKFNMLGDARHQVGTFIALKEKLEQEHATPAEYIDVRIEEKAFYK